MEPTMSNTLLKYTSLAVLAGAACSPPAIAPSVQADAGGSTDAATPGDAASPPVDATYSNGMLDLEGDITGVHDPVIFATEARYYIYSTGEGLPIRESTDLVHWRLIGQALYTKPVWITTTDIHSPNALWAPDLSYFGGQYHLYYAASTLGSQDSCIGHATTATLDAPDWTDRGSVICSTANDNWNAIDPAAIVDGSGNTWLAFGSFWSGIQLIPLDGDGARLGTDAPAELATRGNTEVEAPYLVHRGDFYYLFESVDRCCKGTNSTYKIMVGRSTGIAGPYVDEAGHDLADQADNGGTLLLAGGTRWKGPGHNAILRTTAGDYNVYHSYDANAGGEPTLRIAELQWSADAWPTSAGP
jgi:arabinan endo-1,5-alpha-L-arabinosidase